MFFQEIVINRFLCKYRRVMQKGPRAAPLPCRGAQRGQRCRKGAHSKASTARRGSCWPTRGGNSLSSPPSVLMYARKGRERGRQRGGLDGGQCARSLACIFCSTFLYKSISKDWLLVGRITRSLCTCSIHKPHTHSIPFPI